jgi:ABC-type sugar transport system substrate-binding protein
MFTSRFVRYLTLVAGIAASIAGCTNDSTGGDRMTIGVAFETLQTEYWVASLDAIRNELAKREMEIFEAVSDHDPNRQLQQINNFIARGVDGIIMVPKDAQTPIPMIRAANRAGIPIVLYNRPPAPSDTHSVSVVADNYGLAKSTVEFMVQEAIRSGRKHQALVLIGDMGDTNAIDRRNGFLDAVEPHPDVVEVVSEVPTEWNQEKALAGTTNALQANPDISFIFTSSDFLFPSVVSALKTAGKYKPRGEEGHVILGGFDGDPTAYQMLVDGFLDAVGVQDVYFETSSAVQAILDMKAGKEVPEIIRDKGMVIHQGNVEREKHKMWGAQFVR